MESLESRRLLACVPGGDTNDQICEARTLESGNLLTGTIGSSSTDVDLFEVKTGTSPGTSLDFFFVVAATDGQFDPYLRVFNDSGTELFSNDNISSGDSDSLLIVTLPSTGTYYLGVSAFSNQNYNAETGAGDTSSGAASATGSYQIAASDNNSRISQALPTLSGQDRSGFKVNFENDIDMFELNVKSESAGNRRFTIDVEASGGLDPYLRIFDAAGDQLASDDDISIVNNDARITYNFPNDGLFYLGVSASGNETYGAINGDANTGGGSEGSYTLKVGDHNDEISEIDSQILVIQPFSPTSVSFTGFGEINPSTDVDLWRLDGIEGKAVRLTANRSGGILSPKIRLFDDSGNEIVGTDEVVTSAGTSKSFLFDDTDDFYVGISSGANPNYDPSDGTNDSSGFANGTYALAAAEISFDPDDRIDNAIDLGNLFTDGTRLGSDSARFDGEIDTSVDVDLYKFEVGRNGSFVEIDVDTSTSPFALKPRLNLYNATGGLIAFSSGDNAPGEVKLAPDGFIGITLNAGTYYAGVSAFTNVSYNVTTGLSDTDSGSIFATGSYTIDIQDRLHVDTTGDPAGFVSGVIDTVFANDGENSLREAIDFANTRAGHQTITFKPSPTQQSIQWNQLQGQVKITDSVTIDGPGRIGGTGEHLLKLRGNSNRVFEINNDLSSKIDVTIRGIEIADGNESGISVVRAPQDGGGIWSSENLTLENVAMVNNENNEAGGALGALGASGGAIYQEFGDLTIVNSTFNDNRSEDGGAIYAKDANVTIDASTISGNTADDGGGGIALSGGTLIVQNGSTLGGDAPAEANHANDNGGAVYALNADVTIDASTVSANTAVDGAGLYIRGGTLDVENGSTLGGDTPAEANLADEDGGAINSGDSAVVRILASTISANRAGTGGGILMDGGILIVSGSTLGGDTPAKANHANGDGGAIYSTQDNLVTISASTISANTATNGAGIFMDNGMLVVRFGSILGGDTLAEANQAIFSGGAILAQSDAEVRIDASTISGNTANSGGGIHIRGGTLNVQNGSVLGGDTVAQGNKATVGGGAINAGGSTEVTVNASTISGNTANTGGGIRMGDGTLNILNGSTLGGDTSAEANNASVGGAIFAKLGADVTIDASTVVGNSASQGGGVSHESNTGTLTIRDSELVANSATQEGGAIHTLAQFDIQRSTFFDNQAPKGGAVVTAADNSSIINSTFGENQATTVGIGGAILATLGTLNVTSSTFNSNTGRIDGGADIAIQSNGITNVNIGNSIFANPITGKSIEILNNGNSAFVTSNGNNLAEGNPTQLNQLNDIKNTDPLLGTLTNNGGNTRTYALLAGSPAINAGDNQQLFSLVRPISVATNTSNDFRQIGNVIANNSLTSGNFGSIEEAPADSWVTNGFSPDYFQNGGPDPVIGFNLPGVQALTSVAIWGYKEFAGNDVKDFTLEFSTDGGATFNGSVNLTKPIYTATEFVNVLEFGGSFDANFVRMTITDNHGGDRVGFQEIRFEGVATDQRGEARVVGGTVDIGAFEFDSLDFGDAPNDYPVASHLAAGPRLGDLRDVETNSLASPNADGDDNDGVDDEDGVMFGAITPTNNMAAVNIDLQNATAAKVDAWIDFNADGDWDDAGEQILTSANVVGGEQTLNFSVPGAAVLGSTFARVRVSSLGGLTQTGTSVDGEVEDYQITIGAPSVESVEINGGDVQRSSLDSVRVTFDRAVTFVGVTANAFQLQRISDNQIVPVQAIVSTDSINDRTVVDLTFASGGALVTSFGSLVDGDYKLVVFSSNVNASGVPLAEDVVFGDGNAADAFFRKYGDASGDNNVGLTDFASFRGSFGTSLGEGGYVDGLDANGDNTIGLTDFAAFRGNFGS